MNPGCPQDKQHEPDMPFDSGGSRILSGNQHKQIETMQTYSLPAVNPQSLCGGPVLTTHICDQNDQKKKSLFKAAACNHYLSKCNRILEY